MSRVMRLDIPVLDFANRQRAHVPSQHEFTDFPAQRKPFLLPRLGVKLPFLSAETIVIIYQ